VTDDPVIMTLGAGSLTTGGDTMTGPAADIIA
jgi:hypothetical protein